MFEYYSFNYNPTYIDKIGFKFEQNKDLFEVRYSKYHEYMKLIHTNNVALINLNYLQKHPEKVLMELDRTFGMCNYRINEPFINVKKHTKTQNIPTYKTTHEKSTNILRMFSKNFYCKLYQ